MSSMAETEILKVNFLGIFWHPGRTIDEDTPHQPPPKKTSGKQPVLSYGFLQVRCAKIRNPAGISKSLPVMKRFIYPQFRSSLHPIEHLV